MKQEVRIKLDVSITLDAKHSDEEVRAIVERGARAAWPNNYKYFHSLKYAEERHIYHNQRIQWQSIFDPKEEPTPQAETTNNQPKQMKTGKLGKYSWFCQHRSSKQLTPAETTNQTTNRNK